MAGDNLCRLAATGNIWVPPRTGLGSAVRGDDGASTTVFPPIPGGRQDVGYISFASPEQAGIPRRAALSANVTDVTSVGWRPTRISSSRAKAPLPLRSTALRRPALHRAPERGAAGGCAGRVVRDARAWRRTGWRARGRAARASRGRFARERRRRAWPRIGRMRLQLHRRLYDLGACRDAPRHRHAPRRVRRARAQPGGRHGAVGLAPASARPATPLRERPSVGVGLSA